MDKSFPTTYLRFVERVVPPEVEPPLKRRILQQRWIVMDDEDTVTSWEWRDVALEVEEAPPA